MSDTSLERPRRRLQFSLRRMLLWTVVVAVYCGIAKFFDMRVSWYWFPGPALTLILGSIVLIAIVALLARAFTGFRTAWVLTTIAGGAIDGTAMAWLYLLPRTDLSFADRFLAITVDLVPRGLGLGWMIFLAIEATARTVDWADRRIGKMTKGARDG